MKKMLFLAAVGLLFATGSADAKSVKLGATDDGADREISIKKRPTLTCKGGKILKDGKCVLCSDEVSHCKTCSAESKCLRCETDYALKSDGTCGCANDSVCEDQQYCWKKNCTPLTCKKGFYGKNHKCNACPTGSADCKYDDSKPGVVSTECKRGYYLKDGECLPCSVFSSEYSNCRACTESGCTECDGDGPENGKCVDCSDDDSCAGTQKCVSNKCEELDCGPVAPQDHTCPVCADYGYTTTACGDSYNTVDQNFSASDGACHTCELKTCEQLGYATACGDDQTKEAAGVSGSDGACYTCSDSKPEPGPGPEPGACSSDCDCQWWQVCSNKKCVTASSCTSLDACKRSKGEGGNYSNSNTGNCSSQYINVANMTCWVCPPAVTPVPVSGKCTIGSYADCPTGTVCNSQNGETACHTCSQGSNVSTTFKCNCPADTLSDGKGGCTKKSTGNSNSNSGSNTGKSGSNTGSKSGSGSSSPMCCPIQLCGSYWFQHCKSGQYCCP